MLLKNDAHLHLLNNLNSVIENTKGLKTVRPLMGRGALLTNYKPKL